MRARDLGLPFPGTPGPLNAITDVAGVRVGMTTLVSGENDVSLDAGLVAAAQAVEHYEMARYGTLCAWAKVLGMEDAALLLTQTLEEEKRTDETLTELAHSEINQMAIAAE